MEHVTEARIRVLLATDAKGGWQGADPKLRVGFARVRIEVDPGNGNYAALIDGPVVGTDTSMQAQPGQSAQTILVNDDSVLLNLEERAKPRDKESDSALVTRIYQEAGLTPEVESTQPGADGTRKQFQRATDMQFVRELARRNEMRAWVVPGPQGGESIGRFKKLLTKPDGLPKLVLVGTDRNMESFTTREDAQSPATVTGRTLSVNDKSIASSTVSFRDVQLMGDQAAGASMKRAAMRILPPGRDGLTNVQAAVRRAAERQSYAITADGRVSTGAYPAALAPYRVVTVQGVQQEQCGDYLIGRVRHQMTRSLYSQSFTARRNAVSTPAPAGPSLPDIF